MQRKAEEAKVSVSLGKQNRAEVMRAHVHAHCWPVQPTPQPLAEHPSVYLSKKEEEEDEEDRKKTKENTGAAAINIAFYEAVRWTQCHVSRRRHAPNDLSSWIKVRRKAEVVKVSVSPGKQIRAAVMRAYAPAHASPVQSTPQSSSEQRRAYLSPSNWMGLVSIGVFSSLPALPLA